MAVPVLALLSAGVGNSRAVELKRGWRESPTLFAAVVMAPGEKKTWKVPVRLPTARLRARESSDDRWAMSEASGADVRTTERCVATCW